jgi:hypothetical protein
LKFLGPGCVLHLHRPRHDRHHVTPFAPNEQSAERVDTLRDAARIVDADGFAEQRIVTEELGMEGAKSGTFELREDAREVVE